MKSYEQFKQEQQDKVNQMPYVRFAFGKTQIEKVFKEWGLSYPADEDKVCVIWGTGDIIQKKDVPAFRAWERDFDEAHQKEFDELLTHDEFVHEMFMCELANHEWQLTFDNETVIEACGFEIEEFVKDERLCDLWSVAKKEYWKQCEEHNWF